MANPSTPSDGEYIAEKDLAEILGVNRSRLRSARPSLQGGEATLRGNVVCWARKKAAAFARTLGLQLPEGTPETPTATEIIGELLTVASQPGANGYHFGNPHLIRGRRENGELVVVRVVDSRKYKPQGRNGKPMQLRAQPAKEGQWWVLTGREPRFPGAW